MQKDAAPAIAAAITSELRVWRTSVLNVLLIVVAVAALPALALAIIEALPFPEQWPAALIFLAFYLFIVGLAVFRRLDPRLRAWGLLLLGYATGVLSFARGGLAGDGRVYLLALPVLALILLGVRSSLLMAALSLLTYVFFAATAHLGWMKDWLIRSPDPFALDNWISAGAAFALILITVVVLQWLFGRFQMNTLQAERQAVTDLAQAHGLLRERAEELETANLLLVERTEALAAAAKVARQIATATDEQDLMERFVHLVSERFGLYHVGLFLLDAQMEHAVLRVASSEGGQRMIQRGYQVRIGSEDPVGRVAQGGEGHLVAVPPASLPDLPQTQWRATVPLQVGGENIGVLDVHFDGAQAPSEQRVQILYTLTDQLAIGLENARLFVQAQSSLDELSRLYRVMAGEAWQQFAEARPGLRRYQAGAAEIPQETWTALFAQARSQGQPVSACYAEGGDGGQHALAVPVKLRGVPIGALGFHRPMETGEWRPEEIALTEAVAERAALALENVRLLEETQRRAARERLVSEVTTRMRETLDVETVLRTALQEFSRVAGGARVALWMGDTETLLASAGTEPAANESV